MCDGGLPMQHVVPAKPQDMPSGSGETPVALGIAPSVEQAVMERCAIDFDDDVRLAKQEVDATNPTIAVTQIDLTFRFGERVTASELDEPGFELAFRRNIPIIPFFEQRSEQHGSRPTVFGQVDEHTHETRHPDQSARQCIVQCTFGAPRAHIAAEVEQRSRQARARNAVDDRAMSERKRKRLLLPNARKAPTTIAVQRDGQRIDLEPG
jgi:hypothetical protein